MTDTTIIFFVDPNFALGPRLAYECNNCGHPRVRDGHADFCDVMRARWLVG